jgi:uncharacterized protein YndB with AHSA1/START domain
MTDPATAPATERREYTTTRTFDAPREVVFKAWTEPEQFAKWWGGAQGASTPLDTVHMDARPGGEWRALVRSDDGSNEYPFYGVYREVDPPQRLVFTLRNSREPDPTGEHLVTIDFTERNGKTEMQFSQVGLMAEQNFNGLSYGYDRFFAKLADLVKTA